MDRLPRPNASCWRLAALLRDSNPGGRAALASERLLNLAGGLPPGSRMSLVLAGDGAGRVSVSLHTSEATDELPGLIGWMSEGVGVWEPWDGDTDPHLSDPADIGPIAEVLPAARAPLPPRQRSACPTRWARRRRPSVRICGRSHSSTTAWR